MRSFAEKPKATQSPKRGDASSFGRSDDRAMPRFLKNDAAQGVHPTGRPLDADTRAFMEPRLGRDLGDVRVHSGSEARADASAMSARAFTVGNDIMLGAGENASHTPQGRHLLAHELTHVVQQRSGAKPANGMSTPGDAFERQADSVADTVAEGHSAAAMLAGLGSSGGGSASAPSVMRQTEPRPNPAEYQFVPIEKGGTWDAVAILDRVSQREYTETRITKPQPAEGQESDDYRCGPSAVLATAIVAGPKAVMDLCLNLYKRIKEARDRATTDDESYREKQREARRAGKDPEAVPKEVPFFDVSDKAAKKVFDIHWNLQTGIKFGSHEGGGYVLTFADLDRLSNYLYMYTFDSSAEWRKDSEAAGKAATMDDLKPDVRARLEPEFQKQRRQREAERAENPDLPELTWRQFVNQMRYRARWRTEGEIGDAAVMAGYDDTKSSIIPQDITERVWLDWHLNRLKPGQSMLGMWGPHTYTFFRGQDALIYLYDSWRGAVNERAPVKTFQPAHSVHVQGSAGYNERTERGLSGADKPIRLLRGAAHKFPMF